ncbi:MAG: tetratricopeptide repeat protein, partial [Bacteroidota bacterium]
MKRGGLLSLFLILVWVLPAQYHASTLWQRFIDLDLPDTTRLESLFRLSWDEYLKVNPDTSYWLAEILLDSATEMSQPKYQANALNTQGVVRFLQGQPKQAIVLLRKSLTLYEQAGEGEGYLATQTNLGNIYQKLGDYPAAISCYVKAMEMAEQRNDLRRVATIRNNLGNVYQYEGDTETALAYYFQALNIVDTLKRSQATKASILTNIGNIYANQNQGELALDYFTRGLLLRAQDPRGQAESYNSIGDLYHKIGADSMAIVYLEEALRLSLLSGDKERISLLYGALAEVYLGQGQLEMAESYAISSLEIAKELESLGTIKGSAETLAKVSEKLGNFENAYYLSQLSHEMQDSLVNEENRRALIRQEMAYKYDKQLTLEKEQRERQRIIILAVASGLILALVFAILLFNRLKISQQQQKIIAREKRRAEQSEKHKEQFLANMSHEIRTPMHAISGMIESLKRRDPRPEQKSFLKIMEASASRLLVILNDVLDLSKIEAGKLEIELIPTNFQAVLEEVTTLLKGKAAEKGLDLSFAMEAGVPQAGMADPTRLGQILTNLTGNAIKFTEQGFVQLTLALREQMLLFEVKDSGIGIPAAKQASIFDSFTQAESNTSRQFGGTGLGLSIAQQLVQLHGGEIGVESTLGTGSSFYFTIPYRPVASPSKQGMDPEAQAKALGQELSGLRILLAEDHEFNVMVAKDDLQWYLPEVSIVVAGDGLQAFEQFQAQEFDLILMD